MNVYLLQVGSDAHRLADVEQKLKPVLPELTRIESLDEIGRRAKAASGARAYVLLVARSTEPEHFAELLSTLGSHRGDAFFILISGEISATHYKQLVYDGNADWASESGLPKDVLDIIARVDAKPAPTALEVNRPTVAAFVPSAGGVGNTTVALETAVQLVKRKGSAGKKVCLIDLDFQTSHVCDYLDIEPHLKVEEIIDAPDRLDSQLLDVFASRHSSGLDVLAAPRGKFQDLVLNIDWELNVEVLSALFDLLAQRYTQILIDLPLARHPWTTPVLSASHGILVTGRNTIPGLRQIAETVAAIQAQAEIAAAVRPVVNGCDIDMFGRVARGDHVERVLGRDTRPFFVRRSRGALECVNAGAPMSIATPSDKTVKDIRAIVDFCAELKSTGAAAHL